MQINFKLQGKTMDEVKNAIKEISEIRRELKKEHPDVVVNIEVSGF